MKKFTSSSELPIMFDDNIKTTSVSFFISDLNSISCKILIALHFNYSTESF